MNLTFTEEELNRILSELTDLPIKYLSTVQRIQSIFQQKYLESIKEESEEEKEITETLANLPTRSNHGS